MPLAAFPAGANPPCTPTSDGVCDLRGFEIRALSFVFDEEQDTGGPDFFGLAILDTST